MLITKSNVLLLLLGGILFFGVGIVLSLYLLVPMARETIRINTVGVHTEGHIVSFETRVQTTNSTTGSRRKQSVAVDHPQVSFTDSTRREYTFTSGSGSSNSSYTIGDPVPVLYDPQNPHIARMNTFLDMWAGVLMISVLSLAFLLVGGGVTYYHLRKLFLRIRLRQRGQSVQAIVTSVKRSGNFRINNKIPYVITSEFMDTNSGERHEFKSDLLEKDPGDLVKGGDSIKVFVNPQNYGNYFVDLSILKGK